MQPIFEELSRSLAEAWRGCGTIPLPAAIRAPRSRADAFAIQDKMAKVLGDRCVGWKVGALMPRIRFGGGRTSCGAVSAMWHLQLFATHT